MKKFDQQWARLIALARQADAGPDLAAPYGFSTRVAALAMGGGLPAPSVAAVLERLALRGLVAAGVLSLASAAFSYASLTSEHEDESAISDPVAEVLEIS